MAINKRKRASVEAISRLSWRSCKAQKFQKHFSFALIDCQLFEGEVTQNRRVDSGEAQIFSAKEAAAERMESSPPTSELSTGKMNPQALGCNKRLIALCIQKIYAMHACVCRLRIGAAAPSRTPHPS
uniref:Uncharacterized protein n=1 Tax=Aegilops tauschii TaxID=37682 RepID=M8BNB6_AEGTA